MPRQGRVVLPNYPLHVVQRGHNRQVVFAEDEDYQRYLSEYIELNPIRARMVDDVAAYPWSSYGLQSIKGTDLFSLL